MASAADTISFSAIFNKECNACRSRCASRLAASPASTRCWPTCAEMLPELNHSTSINIDLIFCMSTSPPGGKALDALSLYPSRYNLKSTLTQEAFCKESVNGRMLIGKADLECHLCPNRRFPRWRDKLDSKHRLFGITERIGLLPR